VLNGDETGGFAPNRSMTRAEFSKVLVTAMGVPVVFQASMFNDESSSDWASNYVGVASQLGWMKGKAGNRFAGEDSLTREEVVTILARVMAMTPLKEKVAGVDVAQTLAGFKDASKLSGWSRDAMAAAVSLGLVKGTSDGRLAPGGKVTRAEIAVLVVRMLRTAGWID
jgi:hypothetical protein